MSGRTVSRYIVICDRCGIALGEDGAFPSATEARAAAYNLGWRFPVKVLASGRPSSRADDVCGPCQA